MSPGLHRAGALPIHFFSLSSCKIQTAMLLLLSTIPSCPSPIMPARTGFASPLVNKGTLPNVSCLPKEQILVSEYRKSVHCKSLVGSAETTLPIPFTSSYAEPPASLIIKTKNHHFSDFLSSGVLKDGVVQTRQRLMLVSLSCRINGKRVS